MSAKAYRWRAAVALALLWSLVPAVQAADDAVATDTAHAPHDMAAMAAMEEKGGAPAAADPHAAHHHMMASNEIKRTIVNLPVPALNLVRQDGVAVALDKELNDGRPVVMNFIYTTCTTICPLTSQTFRMLQEKLGADRDKVHLVSISIDPEQDTPARLLEYAQRFHAAAEWQHYTGTQQASIAAQRAFGVFRGDKMNHTPVTLVRGASGTSWVRLDGFSTADDLLAEVRGLSASLN